MPTLKEGYWFAWEVGMTLTDLLSLEQWKGLEREIHERFKVNAAVVDDKGVRITDYANWGNPLCQRIKTDPKGLAAICAPTGQHCTKRMTESPAAFIEECEAGMLKIMVPVYTNGDLLGAVGCCGSLDEDMELDTFLVAKALEADEGEIVKAGGTVPCVSRNKAEETLAWIEARLDELLTA